MAQLIAVNQIVTRERKGGPRIVIPAGSRFETAAYPMISEAEWKAMMSGEHQTVRTPDDPAFAIPQPMELPSEGRSPRTDLASQAVRAAERSEDDDDDDDPTLVTTEADEPEPASVVQGRRGRRRAATEDDDI